MKRIPFYFLFFIFIAGCSRPLLFKETRILMDTFVEISCFSSDRESVLEAIENAFKELERIEKVFSKFDEKSEVSMVNRLAPLGEVNITRELFGVIARSSYYSELTEGSFDITVAPIIDIWLLAQEKGSIPDDETIIEALKHTGYKNIAMDENKLTIRFLDKLMKIDLGGIAKGYAVDRAKDIILSHGIESGLINIGGNMFAVGSPRGKESWSIGIQHPRDKKNIIYKIDLKNRAVSTSGDYERFFTLNGRRFSHIINPIVGRPAEGVVSVTVVADSAEEADALSTAVFVMGVEKGLRFIRSLGNIEAFIFDQELNLVKSP